MNSAGFSSSTSSFTSFTSASTSTSATASACFVAQGPSTISPFSLSSSTSSSLPSSPPLTLSPDAYPPLLASPSTSTAPSSSSEELFATPEGGPSLASSSYSFDFSYYAPFQGGFDVGHLPGEPHYADSSYMAPQDDLLAQFEEYGFILAPPGENPGMAYSQPSEAGPSGPEGLSEPAPGADVDTYTSLFPPYSSDIVLPPSPGPSAAYDSVHSDATPSRTETPPNDTTTYASANDDPVPSTQPPTTVRRSTRQRTQTTRNAKVASPVAKRRRKTKAAPAPAHPVASGSDVQLRGPPAGMKERERATRRTRAQVLEQMAPVMRCQCPRKGCGKKFGISREDDVAHIEEHYPDVTFKAQKVECLWTDCKHIEPRNVLVDHINAKHLRAEFRCLLHNDRNEMCTWSAPRPGDVNQHLERKHGRPKRRWEEGYVKEKNKKRRT
ncbi:hypothetical protein ACG7TL_008203 [Trametes sanguinea]